MTSLVRVEGISVKTTFRGPRQIEFEMPASAIENLRYIGGRSIAQPARKIRKPTLGK